MRSMMNRRNFLKVLTVAAAVPFVAVPPAEEAAHFTTGIQLVDPQRVSWDEGLTAQHSVSDFLFNIDPDMTPLQTLVRFGDYPNIMYGADPREHFRLKMADAIYTSYERVG
jgi:hypothetical protein